MEIAVEVSQLSKRFGENLALGDVSFQVMAGQVHALVGENGAGKSSLIKVLSGVYQPDGGEVLLYGKRYAPHSPTDAQRSGIATMFQESQSVSNLSVAENIFLGAEPRRGPFLDWNQLFRAASELLNRLSITIDARKSMSELTSSEAKLIEMARAVSRKAKVLIMDEPTANLNQAEQQILFNVLRNLNKNEGVTIVYISHYLSEVFDLCDRVTVLRDGQHISTVDVSDTTSEQLVENMIGRKMEVFYPSINTYPKEIRFKASDLSLPSGQLKNVSFEIKAGEIYGVYGLADSGRTALVNVLFGIHSDFQGEVSLDGGIYRPTTPETAIRAGVVLVPEERKLQGLMPRLDLLHNLSVSNLPHFNTNGFFDIQKAKVAAVGTIERLQVKPPAYTAKAGGLSGGNQQKIAIGKWLNRKIKLAIFQEPTRGIDVGAKMEVYNLIKDFSESDVAILLISSEVMELMGICHRVGILSGGRITEEFVRGEFTEKAIVTAALPRR